MPLAVACEHSLAQLKLLMEASGRIDAQKALTDASVTVSAIGACLSKSGGRQFKKYTDQLRLNAGI